MDQMKELKAEMKYCGNCGEIDMTQETECQPCGGRLYLVKMEEMR